MQKIVINRSVIDANSSNLYLIAEIGTNFVETWEINKNIDNQYLTNISVIEEMVKQAKKCGVSAVKFQAYNADKIASKDHPGREYFLKHSFDADFWKKVKDVCDEWDIDFILSIFDVDMMYELGPYVDAIKIASTDINNRYLIESAAIQGKPLVVSTGASNLDDIYKAKRWIKDVIGSSDNVAFLHCVSVYPSSIVTLGAIRYMKNDSLIGNHVIGYSDHSLSMQPVVEAYKIGANIIEKHFTLDKTLKGNDHEHSMTPEDINYLWEEVDKFRGFYVWNRKTPLEGEINEISMGRRYLVYNRNIKEGEQILPGHIKCLKLKEPKSHYLAADKFYDIIGKKSLTDHKEDDIITEVI